MIEEIYENLNEKQQPKDSQQYSVKLTCQSDPESDYRNVSPSNIKKALAYFKEGLADEDVRGRVSDFSFSHSGDDKTKAECSFTLSLTLMEGANTALLTPKQVEREIVGLLDRFEYSVKASVSKK